MNIGRDHVRVLGTALLVCVAYYVGARIGFLLQLPPATTSVMWPPNAILTATLLLTPVRRWWIYALAVVPAHLFVQLGVVSPLPLVGALFVTNWSEALIAALFVRRFSDAPARFDTLRRMAVFIIGAGIVAPFLSSFLDAAAVATLRGEAYWLVWRNRFFSNVLTALTLVPAIVMLADSGRRWLLTSPRRRRVEALLLTIALAAVGTLVLGAPVDEARVIIGSLHSPLLFLLPFLLWAAVRFGPAGASLSLLGTALLTIWASSHGGGPFTSLRPADNVLSLQIFLSMVAIPLLCLSAAIHERRQTEMVLNQRLRFEEMLSRLSSAFVHLPADKVDEAIQTGLGRVGEFLELDRLTLLRFSEDRQSLTLSHSWEAPGIGPASLGVSRRQFPEAVSQLLADAPFIFSNGSDRLAAARDERGQPDTVKSTVTIPLLGGGRVLGGILLDSVAVPRIGLRGLMPELRLVAEVFGGAIASKEAEDALRTSESMKSAILASLTANVAVIDRHSRIIVVNEPWMRYGPEHSLKSRASVRVGANYLDVWREAVEEGRPHAREVLEGIEAVLGGSRPTFSVEYPCRTTAGEQWWAMVVMPLPRVEGGAVVSQTEVSERKRGEIEAQRARQELAHYTRISTVGELTASLAHELNQPLTGIMANAQAARRFLETTPVDVDELRDILSDIVEDDQRASDVIHRLRDLLMKRETELRPLDLNLLIRDVARLLTSDLLIRNVTLTFDLAAQLPVVNGDRVQLQQVVLNLLLNAMEAVGEDGADRTIIVRTEDLESIHVSISDGGQGLRPGTNDLVFEPFYTTKSGGMGMGLSIARSIIEAHGGLIWATPNPTRGATFHFALPLEPTTPE